MDTTFEDSSVNLIQNQDDGLRDIPEKDDQKNIGLITDSTIAISELLNLFEQIPWRNDSSLNSGDPSAEKIIVSSPDAKYDAETYGVNTNITAGGMFPVEKIRIREISTNKVLWEMPGYYSNRFLWSSDSRYVAVSGTTRISGEIIIVDTVDFLSIPVPVPEELSNNMREFRPDPYFSAHKWIDNDSLLITFEYTGTDELIYNGSYIYHLPSREVSNLDFSELHEVIYLSLRFLNGSINKLLGLNIFV
ncbi:hypothetical protein I5677_15630 [Mobilitalea sibirica]|uniref:Uncharacterized protein n=1 Tax=Mobilitalea sibirica TaxID=1462919 RepID=A0A8J7H554_9FIRM|nr:hypothetical protein [Mobilitalea sibirica]MBH1942332.1 hypothetical protein [Mobilitalea sibirica]